MEQNCVFSFLSIFNKQRKRYFVAELVLLIKTFCIMKGKKCMSHLFILLGIIWCLTFESGSTAQNASARISTVRHFFQKCHLLDTKSVNCSTQKVSTARQTKVCRTCATFCFRAVDKKVYLLKFLSRWQNYCDSKK